MPIRPASPEDYDQAQVDLRRELRAPTTEVRNVAIAAETHADSYFSYRGVMYKAPPLSYKLGVQLQEIQLAIGKLVQEEEALTARIAAAPSEKDDEDRIQMLTGLLACYERAVGLFWQACFPLAWWKRRRHTRTNPFTECTSKEIGELLGFFFMCRMKSRVGMVGTLANRPSLSLSTPTTT